MAERDKRAPRIRPVRTVNHIRPDYGGNVNVTGGELIPDLDDIRGRTAGHIVQDEGTDLPQQPRLDFVGDGVTATDEDGVTRVYIPGPGSGPSGHGSWIDVFPAITSDAVAAFALTYAPNDRSWNVELNGIGQVFGTDYTVAGQVVTAADPTDLFRGASADDPWTLHVQYDRLSDLPTPPETPGTGDSDLTWTVGAMGANSGTGTAMTCAATGQTAGDLLVLVLAVGTAAALPTVTGWTLGVSRSDTGIRLGVYTREATDTSADDAAATLSASTSWAALTARLVDLDWDTVTPILDSATGIDTGINPGGLVVAADHPIIYAWAALAGTGVGSLTHDEALLSNWQLGATGAATVAFSIARSTGGAAPDATFARAGAPTDWAYATVAIDGLDP